MKEISYQGTVAGWRKYGRRELLKAAFMGQSLAKDASRIQHRLNRAAAQDRTKRIIRKMQGGIA